MVIARFVAPSSTVVACLLLGSKSVSVPYFDMTIWRDEATDGKISDKNQKHVRTPFKRLEDGIVKAEDLEKQH